MNKIFCIFLMSLFMLTHQPLVQAAEALNANGYYTFRIYNIRVRLPDSIAPVSASIKEYSDNIVDITLPGKSALGGGLYSVMIKDGSRLSSTSEFYKVWIPALRDFVSNNDKLQTRTFKIKAEHKIEINQQPAYQLVVVANDEESTAEDRADTFVVTALYLQNNVIITSKLAQQEADIDFFAPFNETTESTTDKDMPLLDEQGKAINSAAVYYNFVRDIKPYIASS